MGRIIFLAVSGISFLLQVVKAALFFIGSSTVIEDAVLLPEKARAMMQFIEAQPGLVFYGFFSALGLFCLWLAFRSPGRKTPPTTPNGGGTSISSHNQSGGVTAHTVNVGSDDVRKQ